MNNKQIVTGVVGIVVGFILGFFVSQVFLSTPSDIQEQSASALQPASSELPEDHPSPETLEKLRELQAWAEANPEDGQSRIVLGNFYYDLGRFDAAIRWYEEALKIEPGDVSVRTDLGTAYLYSGNPDKALELYKESLEKEPNHPQTLFNIGVAYSASGNDTEAIRSWEKLLEDHPDHPHRTEIEEQIEKARARTQDRS